MVGASHRAGSAPRSKENPKGYIRGYDARTGKRLWIFHAVPRPGEVGNDTWQNASWAYTGHTGVWTQMTVDEDLRIAYLPIEIPTGDYFGGHRPGDNLFGESLVALNLAAPAAVDGATSEARAREPPILRCRMSESSHYGARLRASLARNA